MSSYATANGPLYASAPAIQGMVFCGSDGVGHHYFDPRTNQSFVLAFTQPSLSYFPETKGQYSFDQASVWPFGSANPQATSTTSIKPTQAQLATLTPQSPAANATPEATGQKLSWAQLCERDLPITDAATSEDTEEVSTMEEAEDEDAPQNTYADALLSKSTDAVSVAPGQIKVTLVTSRTKDEEIRAPRTKDEGIRARVNLYPERGSEIAYFLKIKKGDADTWKLAGTIRDGIVELLYAIDGSNVDQDINVFPIFTGPNYRGWGIDVTLPKLAVLTDDDQRFVWHRRAEGYFEAFDGLQGQVDLRLQPHNKTKNN
jgi:hypothetical protein